MISVSVGRGLIQSTEKLAQYELTQAKLKKPTIKNAGKHTWFERIVLGIKH
jgi:hypothetical protein